MTTARDRAIARRDALHGELAEIEIYLRLDAAYSEPATAQASETTAQPVKPPAGKTASAKASAKPAKARAKTAPKAVVTMPDKTVAQPAQLGQAPAVAAIVKAPAPDAGRGDAKGVVAAIVQVMGDGRAMSAKEVDAHLQATGVDVPTTGSRTGYLSTLMHRRGDVFGRAEDRRFKLVATSATPSATKTVEKADRPEPKAPAKTTSRAPVFTGRRSAATIQHGKRSRARRAP